MRTSFISLCLAVLAVMAFAASPDDKPKPSDGDQVSAANRSGWPETDEMVAGRLAIQDHGMQQRAHVLSVIVELKNRSGHALEMEFDPHDLRIEIFNSDGGRIEEAAQNRSGPVPMSHRMTISADAYAGLPTHRGGVGLSALRSLAFIVTAPLAQVINFHYAFHTPRLHFHQTRQPYRRFLKWTPFFGPRGGIA